MPIVEVTYSRSVSPAVLTRLADVLPHAVSLAVECPEEPYDGDLKPGDVELRFRPLAPLDASGLDVLVEVRSKWFESREVNREERCNRLLDLLAPVVAGRTGVYLVLPVAGWAQR